MWLYSIADNGVLQWRRLLLPAYYNLRVLNVHLNIVQRYLSYRNIESYAWVAYAGECRETRGIKGLMIGGR